MCKILERLGGGERRHANTKDECVSSTDPYRERDYISAFLANKGDSITCYQPLSCDLRSWKDFEDLSPCTTIEAWRA